jgi:DNA-binding GntR family transcriptional regulator
MRAVELAVSAKRKSEVVAGRHRSQQRMAALRPITLVDQVVDAVIKAAAEGHILPGDRVVEADIANELNVSRVPVREALRLLESQGIVVNTPYRGMRLMEVDGKRLHQILMVRSSLEQLAVRELRAAYRRDPRVLSEMEAALAEMKRAADQQDAFALARSDTAFHRALCRLGGNDVLLQIWETLARRLTIIFGLAALTEDVDWIYREHVGLLRLIKGAGARALDKALHDHIVRYTEMVDFDAVIAEQRRKRGRTSIEPVETARSRSRQSAA